MPARSYGQFPYCPPLQLIPCELVYKNWDTSERSIIGQSTGIMLCPDEDTIRDVSPVVSC